MKKHLEDIKEILEDTNFQLGQKLNEVGEQYGPESKEFETMRYFTKHIEGITDNEIGYAEDLLSKFIKK